MGDGPYGKPKNPKPASDKFGLGGDMPTDFGASDEPGPIGVPKGYTVTPPYTSQYGTVQGSSWHVSDSGTPTVEPVKPTYMDGSQYKPGNQSPVKIWQQQQMLARMGLLKGSFIEGVWDEATANAWASVLAYANQRGINDQQAFMQLARGAISPKDDLNLLPYDPNDATSMFDVDDMGNIRPHGLKDLPPLTITTTDPRVLKNAVREASLQLTGYGMDEGQLNTIAQAYNEMERQRQTQNYNAQLQGGEVTGIPSPQDYIESYIRDKEAPAVAEHGALGLAEDAMSLLSSPAWGAS